MNHEQMLVAFIAKLVQEAEISPLQIQDAVTEVRGIRIGETIIKDDDPLVASFANEQAQRLLKSR